MTPQEEKDPGHEQSLRLLEAILFASAEPLSLAEIQERLGPDAKAPALLEALQIFYEKSGVNLVQSDGFWRFRTALDLAPLLTITKQPRRKLPRAAAEVLAIIAYHQPVTRGEIESIRGVETSRGTLDILLELNWIAPGKRRETPGRPLTWKTTQAFLDHFNLESLAGLPGIDELKAAGLLDARTVFETPLREDGESEEDDFPEIVEEL